MSSNPGYLLAGKATELARLQLQSRVWEPAGRELLATLAPARRESAVDVGCGVMGWLRILSAWVQPNGSVVGSDIDDKMLASAAELVRAEGLSNVKLVKDDLFASELPARSFDLVHARFQIAPLGRAVEQLDAYMRLVRPGGVLVLEDPDIASWRVNPDAPATSDLISLIDRGFEAAGGNFSSGREIPSLMRNAGLSPHVSARVIALEPAHPYLRLPLQFAAALRPRLESLVAVDALQDLLQRCDEELAREDAWGTTFTLIQAHATVP
jgi:SAM-dependent methyltransferase